MATDVTNLIERLEAFEERLGVTLEGLFASVNDNGYPEINGELHAREGTQIDQDIRVVISLHDAAGRVLATSAAYFGAESFFGFETFSIFLSPVAAPLSKIRIYPKTA